MGSSDDMLPPDKKLLLDNFNKLYTMQTEEEFSRNPNPSYLTVGA
jgi:hypothetical protein